MGSGVFKKKKKKSPEPQVLSSTLLELLSSLLTPGSLGKVSLLRRLAKLLVFTHLSPC